MAWDFDKVLNNEPLVTVENRIDEWGTFEVRIGSIPTIVTIELGRHMYSDETKVSVSHVIHTPPQAGPYRTSRTFWDDPEYALLMTLSGLTQYYNAAVRAGHTPSSSWLVPY
jgi:hypothetical protein